MAEGWSDYLVAIVGASAALAGLVFVGVSLNLERILRLPGLVNRGLETLLDFVVVLIVASLLLMPVEEPWVAGLLVLVSVLVLRSGTFLLQRAAWPGTAPEHRPSFRRRIAISLLVSGAFLAGALTLLAGSVDGLYAVGAAITLSLLMGVLNAWVLLVEINR